MTSKEAFELESCPECGGPIMKVVKSGLVACLASINFKPCKWHVRVTVLAKEKKKK